MDDYGQDRFLEHLELEEDKVGDRNLMGIYKKWSGLIFDDAFQSGEIHSRYQLSPTTACTLDTGLQQFIMSHTEPETMLLFDAPKDEPTLLLEVTADYVPIAYGDEGGLSSGRMATIGWNSWRVRIRQPGSIADGGQRRRAIDGFFMLIADWGGSYLTRLICRLKK